MAAEIIGRYELIRELGRGGMAVVHLAYDPHVKRQVAVKVLPYQFTADPQLRARFQREAELIAALEHPAITPIYDFGEHAGQPYLVMRYMPGGSLADRLERGPMSLADTVRFIDRIGPALDFAHQKGIVHRDLKPGNILFDNEGNPYIADFGIARFISSQTGLTGSFAIGTPAYMSPEQFGAEELIDHRSDIYAMGIILFEMLSGAVPFLANTPAQVMKMHLMSPVPPIRDYRTDLPGGVQEVLDQILAKEREKRFQSNAALARAFSGLIPGGESSVYAPPTMTLFEKNAGSPIAALARNRFLRWAALGLTGFTLMICALTAAALALQPDTPRQTGTAPVDAALLTEIEPTITPAPNVTETPSPPTASLAVVDAATDTPEATATSTPLTWEQGRMVFTLRQGNAHAIYLLGDGNWTDPVLIYNPGGAARIQGVNLSPDGTRIAYYLLEGGQSQSYVIDAVPGAVPKFLGDCSAPAWSPDGEQIVCRIFQQFEFRDASTGEILETVPISENGLLPVWSPAGNEIAYAVLDDPVTELWVLNIPSTLGSPLATNGSENYAPAWSPDGNRIAFQSNFNSQQSEIWVIQRTGDDLDRLTNGQIGAWSRAPWWSPDGNWIAFISNQDQSFDIGYGEIYVINVNTGQVERITFTGGIVYEWRVGWGP